MEELGGANRWTDRFVAQHAAVLYFWVVVGIFLWNPKLAYNLNEAVEEHAYQTYDRFVQDNEAELRRLPAQELAKDYYQDGDLYMFDAMQTDVCEPRRPSPMQSLYDVFVAIREDERQHVKTMQYLQTDAELQSSHDENCIALPCWVA